MEANGGGLHQLFYLLETNFVLGSASTGFSRKLPSDLTSPPSMSTRASSQSVPYGQCGQCREHTCLSSTASNQISKKDPDLTICAVHGPARLTLHFILRETETWLTMSSGAAGH